MRLIVVEDDLVLHQVLRGILHEHLIVGYFESYDEVKAAVSLGSIPEADIVILDGLGNDGPKVYELFRSLREKNGQKTHVVGWSSDIRYVDEPRLLGDSFVQKGNPQKLRQHVKDIGLLLG